VLELEQELAQAQAQAHTQQLVQVRNQQLVRPHSQCRCQPDIRCWHSDRKRRNYMVGIVPVEWHRFGTPRERSERVENTCLI